eukprot:354855_1
MNLISLFSCLFCVSYCMPSQNDAWSVVAQFTNANTSKNFRLITTKHNEWIQHKTNNDLERLTALIKNLSFQNGNHTFRQINQLINHQNPLLKLKLREKSNFNSSISREFYYLLPSIVNQDLQTTQTIGKLMGLLLIDGMRNPSAREFGGLNSETIRSLLIRNRNIYQLDKGVFPVIFNKTFYPSKDEFFRQLRNIFMSYWGRDGGRHNVYAYRNMMRTYFVDIWYLHDRYNKTSRLTIYYYLHDMIGLVDNTLSLGCYPGKYHYIIDEFGDLFGDPMTGFKYVGFYY